MPASAARAPLPLWAAVLVAAVSGFVYDLAFPDVGWWPLAFVGIAGSLLALIGRRAWGAVLVGLVFGVAFYLRQVSWTSLYLGPVPWLALSILESLFLAAGAVLIAFAYRWIPRAFPSRWARLTVLPLVVAGLWCIRELVIGSFPYGGFPWARAAASQSESPFADAVSWVGFIGVSLVVVTVSAGILEWVRLRGWRDPRTAIPVVALAAVAMLVPPWSTSPSGELTVASVQGNGAAGYFDERARGDLLRAQLDASEPILDTPGVDLLLWPEGSSDLDPTTDPMAARVFDELGRRIGAPVLLNTVTESDGDFFNTSILWQAGEGATAEYSKRHPVPFGEYIPDRDFYMMLAPDLIGLVQRGYAPGTDSPVMDLDGTPVGLAICFDVIYDDVIHEAARDGAEVYLMQTNNADFRGTDENLQQLAVARLRAIETGRSVVNLSTVGTSQVIDATGRTVDSLPAYEAGSMVTAVELRTGLTPAVVLGPAIPWVITLGSLGMLATAGVLARRR